jgi:hypothetical protein
LTCSMFPVPSPLFTAWPPSKIRSFPQRICVFLAR